MPSRFPAVDEPRKSPLQARSSATVDAILQATLQVLVAVGKERLTTTLVAARAGCSVGTLYQYFPNKAALLKTVLSRHLDATAREVELACRAVHGQSAPEMLTTFVRTFFAAKLRDPAVGVALYAVSADIDSAALARSKATRTRRVLEDMLRTCNPPLAADAATVASVLQGATAGVIRNLLESPAPLKRADAVCEQTILLVTAYLRSLVVHPPSRSRVRASPRSSRQLDE